MGSILKLSEAAQTLCVGVPTLKRIIARGEIETITVGRRVLVKQSALAEYLSRNTKQVSQ